MTTYLCDDEATRQAGVAAAVRAVRSGELVVLPTDTVYGIGCDAFDPQAVQALLAAKERGPDMPVPVLIGSPVTLGGLTADLPPVASPLAERFWPGGLTLICWAQQGLTWDLGNTNGTVALRMPDNDVALEVLREVGPMAVSSANRSGQPSPQTAADAQAQLGEAVAVYLDAGPTPGEVASTIINLTVTPPKAVRYGVISLDQLREIAPDIVG